MLLVTLLVQVLIRYISTYDLGIPRNSARLKLVYWTLTLSGKIAAQFTSFSLIDQMNLLLNSCADYYGTPLPCVTIAHITHGTQSVAVLILGS